MQTPDTLAKLAARLQHHADMSDAFGPTEEGHVMRLAAAVITELETTLTQQLQSLEAELNRITRERANLC
jgi:hypothetical protein